ncbi:MAG: hypothetical protein DRP50_08570 [Thermotoga sp.]|nr:MAG: hypothetical protein DRP50_08570 [Thermotoga sp.]
MQVIKNNVCLPTRAKKYGELTEQKRVYNIFCVNCIKSIAYWFFRKSYELKPKHLQPQQFKQVSTSTKNA